MSLRLVVRCEAYIFRYTRSNVFKFNFWNYDRLSHVPVDAESTKEGPLEEKSRKTTIFRLLYILKTAQDKKIR